ncbi:GNAT family N-acetyltransferase [Metabacillus fastidiosus]|uniref:GNAT family N-acetyltransferase n=1 Tax=Metabacillus fastidiosus TaxID=1458 RepID=A0ABU6NTG7_9BACI|nr:GNAT family N-acetyltransferase [Metabacillus fastidiosus]MED4400447.1 GNAT family N-acetyltransferase [Metabacillus fastidiosus]MED4464331.1 GNAT family N-acetyltransferase [Metabacillus fastidiosus]
MDITIRNLENTDELTEVRNLETMIWTMDDPVPVNHMMAAIKSGGLVLGAFLNEKLIGFQYSFPGFDGKKSFLHSHNLGIHSDYRKLGIGMKLKYAQKEAALKKGYDVIKWTYDPLETVNGNLNLHKLGAVCNTYIENVYGEMTDQLNKGLPSDRFLVEWEITKEKTKPAAANYTPILTVNRKDNYLVPEEINYNENLEWLSLCVPANFQELKKENLELALLWRETTRKAFTYFFSKNYLAVDLIREQTDETVCHYILKRS